MNKVCTAIIVLMGLLFIGTSCNKTKTYAEYLAEEKDAIKDFIRDSSFVVLNEFPADGKFKTKEFFKDENSGVYFNIMDRGDIEFDTDGNIDDSSRAQIGETVYIRYNGLTYFSNDTIKYNNMDPESNPMPDSFKYYGIATLLNLSSYYSETCAGWTIPLKYIGHRARVKMIIPFNFGWSFDRSNSWYVPTYYDMVIYRFANHL